jgi:hypothetical protein
MQRREQHHHAFADEWDDLYTDEAPERKAPIVAYSLAGFTLALIFAFAGHYMGQNAVARTAPVSTAEFTDLISPATTSIIGKGSLLAISATRDLEIPEFDDQQIIASNKSDFLIDESFIGDPLQDRADGLGRLLVNAPSSSDLDDTFKIVRKEKDRLIAQRKFRLAESDCLARAIYFEARSESEMGQLAVAKVVLNRVKDPNYPKTICGVVYQGASRTNACQFSFACDGISDQPKSPIAWDQSKKIAARALAGDQSINILGAATYYHADYVNPKWSSSFKRLIKIGRHIFYTDS